MACTLCISLSTSRLEIRPRKMAATVRYLPTACVSADARRTYVLRVSIAAMLLYELKPCCTSSGTVSAWYAWDVDATRGA